MTLGAVPNIGALFPAVIFLNPFAPRSFRTSAGSMIAPSNDLSSPVDLKPAIFEHALAFVSVFSFVRSSRYENKNVPSLYHKMGLYQVSE